MTYSLLYHDLVERDADDASGFPGAGAARYKLTPAEFRDHLDAIARQAKATPTSVLEALSLRRPDSGLFLTFDDGGISSTAIADLLEERGWRGHFFVTTDYIDAPTFVSAAQLRDLHARGHVIGSHSCSHPPRMSHCAWEELSREWSDSRNALMDVLGSAVDVASVPGGFYAAPVARAAASAGYRVLFTSEPTARTWRVNGCLIFGRYTVYRGMPAARAGALAAGKPWPRWGQAFAWQLKKWAKAFVGQHYLDWREQILARAYSR